MDEDYLLISGIQHFCFCRRQWALIHIEDYWKENSLTAEGRIIHDRAHCEKLVTRKNGVVALRGLKIRSSRLCITGSCDVVELIPDENGITMHGRTGRWRVHPVEYKRGKPKDNDCDRLQLAAECICLEEMLLCKIEQGSLFYAQTKHREIVDIDDKLRESVESTLKEMWELYIRRHTPVVKPGKFCKSCSLTDECMPKLAGNKDVNEYIKAHVYEDTK